MTEHDWENETTDVSEVHARDTVPAPPPTEPEHEPPHADVCTCTESQLAAHHEPSLLIIGERCPRCGGVVQE